MVTSTNLHGNIYGAYASIKFSYMPLALFFFLTICMDISSATKIFTGPGNFSDPTKWNAGVLPVAGDDLTIEATCKIDDNAGTDNVTYGSLTIGGTSIGRIEWVVTGTNRLNVNNVSSSIAGSSLDMTNGGTLIIRGSLSNTNLTFTPGTGTVELLLSGMIMDAYTTFNNLTINSSGTITTDTNITINGNLTVTTGTFSIGAFDLTVIGTSTINGILNITSTSGTRTFGHLIVNGTYSNSANDDINSISGNFENNGTFNIGTGRITFTGATSNTISGTAATTAFGGGITVNKGTDYTNVLDVQGIITMLDGGLTLTNGTFKLSSASTIIPFTADITSPPYLIPSTAGLWCNGGTINSLVGGVSWSPQGLIRVSAGTINAGAVSGDFFAPRDGASIIIDGGNLNTADRISQTGASWTFSMTSGAVTVATVGSSTFNRPVFNMNTTGCSFSMSGGTMILVRQGGSPGQNLGYYNIATGGTGFTGGTLQIGNASTPAGTTIKITTTGPVYNLLVNNAGVTARIETYSLTVTNDLIIAAGTLNANSLDITLGGNWSNSGTFTASTGTVNFNSGNSQTISQSGTGDFYNLTVNKAANDVTLNNSVTVTKLLTLTARRIILGANDLTIDNSGAISGANSTNYIVTNSTGKLIQKNVGSGGRTGSILFPVGYSTSAYTPLTIDNSAGTADAFDVLACQYQHTDGTCAGTGENISDIVRVTWQVNEAVVGGSNATVSVTWNSSDEGTNFNNANCGITTYNGSSWTTPSSYSNASATRTVSKTLTTMYPLSVRDNSASNMTYISSTVLQNNTDSVLQAAVRQEIVCVRIYVEGSASPLKLTRLEFNVDGGNGTGSEDPIFDITKAQVYYTGTSSTFVTTNLFGTRNYPSGNFSIIDGPGTALVEGYNYFWLTYNINGHANTTHRVDAKLNSFRLSGTTYSDMAVNAPIGCRPIKGASYYYAIGSGNLNNITIWSWNLAGGGDNGIPCNCAPNGSGIIVIDTNYTVTLTSDIVFDGIIVQQGASINYTGANIDLRLSSFLTTQGTGRFQLDSINLSGDLDLNGSGLSSSNSFIKVGGDMNINSGTTITAGNNITVSGNLTVNGTISLGNKTLTMDGGNNFEIGGRGNITGSNKVIVSSGNKIVTENTDLTVQPAVEIQGAYTITNNDSITIQGNLTGTDASSTWINDTSSVLIVAGSLLTTGQLTTISPDNTIHYNGTSQNVKSTIYNHLTFSGSGTKTVLGNIIANGDISILTSTLSANMYDINLKGDWSNNGGFFIPTAGTVTFDGTSPQSITNTTGEVFYNLTLNKSSNDLILNNSSTVNNILTLSAGKIILGTSNLTIGDSGSISGGSSSNFIVTDNTGLLRQQNIGSGGRTGSVFFPVGHANISTAYSPVILDNSAGTADRFDVKVCDYLNTEGTCNGGTQITSKAVNKTWTINETTAGGSNANITIQWNALDELALFDRTDCFISHHNGTRWGVLQFPGASSGTNPYTKSITGVSSFSPFGVGSTGSALPIELIVFEAKPNNNVVDLNWETSSETNNDYFTIERSADGIHFAEVTKVKGAGNSSTVLKYKTTDYSPLNNISYYRLKQTDYDGKYQYSKVVRVEFITNEISMEINYDSGVIVKLNGPKNERGKIIINDLLGREFYSETILMNDNGNTFITINEKLPVSVYIITFITDNKIKSKKIFIE